MIQRFFEESLKEAITKKERAAKLLNCDYKFIIEGNAGGTWHLLCRGDGAPRVTQTPTETQCTLIIHEKDFYEILSGHSTAQAAFFRGKLRVIGDIRAAIRLGSLIT